MNTNRRIMIKSSTLSLFLCIVIALVLSFRSIPEKSNFIAVNSIFQEKINLCINAYKAIDQQENIEGKRLVYWEARKQFKYLEPILSYFFTEEYETLNQANLLGVEELGGGKFQQSKAFGFQVTEELLYSEDVLKEDFELNHNQTLTLLNELKTQKINDPEPEAFLDLLRNQIVRTASLGITGFDSPQKKSLQEAAYSYQTLNELIKSRRHLFSDESIYSNWKKELNAVQQLFVGDFDAFDRYSFIKEHTHIQLQLLLSTAKDWEVSFPRESAFLPDATSLFSDNTFQSNFFVRSEHEFTEERSALGEQLFMDKKLSRSGKLSCQSCHQKEKGFTDGLVHFEGQERNTPTLLYSVLQNEYFYDLRSENIRAQITQVVENPAEFHTDLKAIVQKIREDTTYAGQFEKAYSEKANEGLFLDAISQYLKTLNPFNSKFDRNINGQENTLSNAEKNGFNLFMGKAECGTCHFAPVFNGTVPPYFTTTEMELLGVPKDSSNKQIDDDFGRYDVNQTENRKHFFKTPTVRNVSKTAPYMHNGAYSSLFEVVEFYDDGGGQGLGFDLPFQTLQRDSLHLSEQEIDDLIAFMNSLEDN